MELRRRHLRTAADLRALSHPVRLELLELLAIEGPMTATEAATRLGQSPANLSWHLRKLGEHGFLEQDRSGPGRKRPWRLVAQAHSWGEDAEDPRAAAALLEMVVEREIEVLRSALARHADEPAEWRAATNVNRYHAWLTPDEARELSATLLEQVVQYAPRAENPGARPPGARLMAMMSWIVPYAAERA